MMKNLFEKGVTALQAHDYNDAVKYFTQGLEIDPQQIDPRHPYFLNMLGVTRAYQGDLARALELFTESIKIKSDCWSSYFFIAGIYIKLNKLQSSLLSINKAIELHPSYFLLYYFRSKVFERLNDLENCKKDVDKAYELLQLDKEIRNEKK